MHAVAKTLIMQVIANKRAEIERTELARQASLKDAQEAEGAMISRYDTFLEEAQYLAGGQNKRLLEAQGVVSLLDSLLRRDVGTTVQAVVGSVVSIEEIDTGEIRNFLIVFDGAGGETFSYPSKDGETISVVSPSSPIGKALFGKKKGDDIECQVLGGMWEIMEIL